MDRQITEPGPNRGGVVRPDWGIAEPTGTYGLVAVCGMLYVARAMRPDAAPTRPVDDDLLFRMALAMGYLRSVQRPSGLIDLRDCNYDSSPDAGFAVQSLCPLIELGRPLRGRSATWDGILAEVEAFVRRLTIGMLDGGFHTPNHRWVIAAALAYAGRLFSDIPVGPVIDAYVAEGYDANADGAYIERSAGVYDAICDRSLLHLSRFRDDRSALEAAYANLVLNLHMLNADGTIETGASRRQDLGTKPIPGSLTLPYLMADLARADDRFVAAADLIWTRGRGDAAGLAAHLLQHGEPRPVPSAFPFDFARAFPTIGLWRSRRAAMSATAFAHSARLFTLTYGRAEIASIKISQSYFGTGRFTGDDLNQTPTGCALRSEGRSEVHRPGYDLPLGRPVAPDRWFETRPERDWRPLPRCASELVIEEAPDGFDLLYRTLDGIAGVTAQIALDFAPGGVWETDDTCVMPVAGQTLFLKRGRGRMRYGHDVIEIGPGADSHRMWAMRDAETAPGHARILITFETPVEHRLSIRCRREP